MSAKELSDEVSKEAKKRALRELIRKMRMLEMDEMSSSSGGSEGSEEDGEGEQTDDHEIEEAIAESKSEPEMEEEDDPKKELSRFMKKGGKMALRGRSTMLMAVAKKPSPKTFARK